MYKIDRRGGPGGSKNRIQGQTRICAPQNLFDELIFEARNKVSNQIFGVLNTFY